MTAALRLAPGCRRVGAVIPWNVSEKTAPYAPRPYLFPVPAAPLRALLNTASAAGEKFSEEQAALDVMLALDRGDLKPYRYYAKRWGWSEGTTYRKLAELEAQAGEWRAFYAGTPEAGVKQDGADLKQDEAKSGPDAPENAGSEAHLKQDGADLKQYRTDLRPQTSEVVGVVAARETPPLPDGVAAYADEAARLLALPASDDPTAGRHGLWLPGGERHRLACRALKTGNAPARSVRDRLDGWVSEHGPGAVLVALLATDAGADDRSRYEPRCNYVAPILRAITDHADTLRTRALVSAAPDAGGSGGPVGTPRRAEGPSGGRAGGRSGRPEPVRATAAQRASGVSFAVIDRLLDSVGRGVGGGPRDDGGGADDDAHPSAGGRGEPPRLT